HVDLIVIQRPSHFYIDRRWRRLDQKRADAIGKGGDLGAVHAIAGSWCWRQFPLKDHLTWQPLPAQPVGADAGDVTCEVSPRCLPRHLRSIGSRDVLPLPLHMEKWVLHHKHEAAVLPKAKECAVVHGRSPLPNLPDLRLITG